MFSLKHLKTLQFCCSPFKNTIYFAMNTLLKSILIITLVVFVFSSCRKKAFDDYYNRPDSLAAPIYQQLFADDIGHRVRHRCPRAGVPQWR